MSTSSESSTPTTVPSLPKRRGRTCFSLRLARVEALVFLGLASIAKIYMLLCSTQPYAAIYTEEEWQPTVVKRANRRVVQFDVNASSFNHGGDLASNTTVTHYRSENGHSVTEKEYKPHPRVVFWNSKNFKAVKGRKIRSGYDLGSMRKPKTRGRPSWSLPTNTTFCKRMKSWQTKSFPTCNNMHEISLTNENEERAWLLGTGGWRATWKVDNKRGETVAFKTLKWEGQNFDKMTEKRHRVDAVAAERLTSSRHVVNIHGYCGQSVINEYADNGSLTHHVQKHMSSRHKLSLAREIALGVVDLHSFAGEGNATIVHRDLKPDNIIVTPHGQPKLNDFNDAEFLSWNTQLNRHCPFRRKRWTAVYHSPEEVWESILSEKVDVFALGGIIFFIMTGHHPYKRQHLSKTAILKLVAKGVKATIPTKVKHSKDPAIRALIEAFEECQTFFPSKRPSARDIANKLTAALESLPANFK